jgi:hypothetical protein
MIVMVVGSHNHLLLVIRYINDHNIVIKMPEIFYLISKFAVIYGRLVER